MSFDHIHLPSALSISILISYTLTLESSFLPLSIKFNLCYSYICECLVFHWIAAGLPVTLLISKTIYFSPCRDLVCLELAWCNNLCKFVFVAVILFLENAVPCTHSLPIALKVFLIPLLQASLSLENREYSIDFSLGAELS